MFLHAAVNPKLYFSDRVLLGRRCWRVRSDVTVFNINCTPFYPASENSR